jgi:Protein of unknown function (DUF3606)
MPDTAPNLASSRMPIPLIKGWDIDFLRAKFNVSSKEVEKAIQYAGNSREKMIEYFRKLLR